MSQALDPVTRNHIDKAAAALAAEFAGVFSEETIARYIGESLDLLGDSSINVFVPVLAHRFARERLKALAQVEGALVKEQPEVLFVCVHNAGRSQMAAGLVRLRSEGRVHVRSAGRAPASEIKPPCWRSWTRSASTWPRGVPEAADRRGREGGSDVVITMGCGDACPIYPGKRYEDWDAGRPGGQGRRRRAADPRRDRRTRDGPRRRPP